MLKFSLLQQNRAIDTMEQCFSVQTVKSASQIQTPFW